jgi:hypothetical protein
MIDKIFSKDALTYFFIVTVFVSFLLHVNFRQSHFQELDSSGVYYVLNNFPTSAMNFVSMSYGSDSFKVFKTKEAAEDFFNQELVDKNLRAVLGAKYNEKNKEMIISQIYEGKSMFFYLRAAEILVLNKIVNWLPTPIFTSIIQPLSSTYSPGPGFFYGFMGVHSTYDDFMRVAGTFHLLVFHLGVLIMFFAVQFLSKNRFTALTVGSLMLFSFSLYSYAHHMGSVTWNIFVPTIFVGLLLYYYQKNQADILRRVSIFSSWLLLFSYLVPYLWFATVTSLVLIDKKSGVSIFNWAYLKKIIYSQKWFLISSVVCLLLILPPSQGFRGSAETVAEFLQYFYYGVLNFFYLYGHFAYLALIEFLVFFALLVGGLYIGYKKIRESENKLIWYYIISLLVLYIVSVVFNVLSFIPSRHILFLTPVLFILVSFALDALYKRLALVVLVSLNILLISFGFYSVIASQTVTYDQTLKAEVPNNIETVVVYGETYPLRYRFEDSHNAFIKKGNVLLIDQIEPNLRYLYVSQLECTQDILKDAADEGINIVIENKKQYVTNQKFIAFDPSNFIFNSPNNFCQAEFIWKQ